MEVRDPLFLAQILTKHSLNIWQGHRSTKSLASREGELQANNVVRAASQECIGHPEGPERGVAKLPGDAGKHLFNNMAFRLSLF